MESCLKTKSDTVEAEEECCYPVSNDLVPSVKIEYLENDGTARQSSKSELQSRSGPGECENSPLLANCENPPQAMEIVYLKMDYEEDEGHVRNATDCSELPSTIKIEGVKEEVEFESDQFDSFEFHTEIELGKYECLPSLPSETDCKSTSDARVKADPTTKTERVATYNRKCVYKNCNNTVKNCGLAFFSFPVSDMDRCQTWLVNSGQEQVIGLSSGQLRSKKICANHFLDRAFTNETKRRLLPNRHPYAVPVPWFDSAVLSPETEVTVIPSGQAPGVEKQGSRPGLAAQGLDTERVTTYNFKCVYKNCNNTGKNCSLAFFSFPATDLDRCQTWLVNSGQEQLIGLSSSQLRNKKICSTHFVDRAFTNETKRRLLPNRHPYAVPVPWYESAILPPETEVMVSSRQALGVDKQGSRSGHAAQGIDTIRGCSEYLCKECGFVCDLSHQLTKHKREVHRPNEKFAYCDICQKTFASKDNLYTHKMRIHTDIITPYETFTCGVCSTDFGCKVLLREHIKRKHLPPPPPPRSRKFICDHCGHSFALKKNLVKHLLVHSKHRREVHRQCKQAGDLKKNMSSNTGEHPHDGSECDCTANQHGTLKDLMGRKNQIQEEVRTHSSDSRQSSPQNQEHGRASPEADCVGLRPRSGDGSKRRDLPRRIQ